MTSTNEFSSSTRNRKLPNKNPQESNKQRIVTRSSQKSPINDENDNSFMSNINSVTTTADENQSPTIDDIHDIEQVKLIYETANGHTNLARVATKNAQILSNRMGSKTNTTYSRNTIDDTQTDTLAIPDTIPDMDTQHNDTSWQRDIDRLMKKLEEPSPSVKSQTQIEESQFEEEEVIQSRKIQTSITTVIRKDEIGIQTENSLSTTHQCCSDISSCPCVIRYSKLERLFMEKMSRFINIVPAIPPPPPPPPPENHSKHRNSSRFRRFRGYRRINKHRIPKTSIETNQSTTIEEISDEITTEEENNNPKETNVEIESIDSNNKQNLISTNVESIDDISRIEKLNTTDIIDQTSTLLMSSTTNDRHLVLTTSSLDENQKSQFRLFLTRFGFSTSSTVDSSTTHIIVNETSPLICPLTGKIIQGIARHLFIVSFRWLTECLSENSIIDERPYEIRGDTSLGNDHGGMRRSRLSSLYLLEKYSICLRCSSNDCAPLQTIEQVQELIELSGGKLVQNFSDIKTIDNQRQMILVLGINGFSGGEKKRKALLDTCQQFNVKCVNIHWLLISIAKFEIQPFENYYINNQV